MKREKESVCVREKGGRSGERYCEGEGCRDKQGAREKAQERARGREIEVDTERSLAVAGAAGVLSH